jgi:hypothetical protein
MATYIEIVSTTNGAKVFYNQLAQISKMKEGFLSKKAVVSIALSSDESWVEVETVTKSYQFSYPVANSSFAIIELIDTVTITSNKQLFDSLINILG